ncbi:hypothetical protein B0H12DRAFT_1244120 [Mycena haematopus]|nr:hypothetical protein B0H12DRAFT_1244120 [Mycena haematopus]
MPRALTNDELETRKIVQSIYSARYYRKYVLTPCSPLYHWFTTYPDLLIRHRDKCNAQTRERMARLRAQERQLPDPEIEARVAARREAARKYREKNHRVLAMKARQRRAHAKPAVERHTL